MFGFRLHLDSADRVALTVEVPGYLLAGPVVPVRPHGIGRAVGTDSNGLRLTKDCPGEIPWCHDTSTLKRYDRKPQDLQPPLETHPIASPALFHLQHHLKATGSVPTSARITVLSQSGAPTPKRAAACCTRNHSPARYTPAENDQSATPTGRRTILSRRQIRIPRRPL